MRRSRPLAAALLALPLVACGSMTDPLSLEIQFVGNHATNASGTCTVQFAARAAGIGSISWERVEILQGTTVTRDLRGEQTAEFWGDDRLRAGQQQLSAPFEAPDRATGTRIELTYRPAGGDTREATLRPSCP